MFDIIDDIDGDVITECAFIFNMKNSLIKQILIYFITFELTFRTSEIGSSFNVMECCGGGTEIQLYFLISIGTFIRS